MTVEHMNHTRIIATRRHTVTNFTYLHFKDNPDGDGSALVTTHVLKGPIDLNAGDEMLIDSHEVTVIPSGMNREERRAYEKRNAKRKPLVELRRKP